MLEIRQRPPRSSARLVLTHLGSGVQLPSGKHVAVQESAEDRSPSLEKWYPFRHSKATVAFVWYHVLLSEVLFSLPLATCGCGHRTERKNQSRRQLSKRVITTQVGKKPKKFVKMESVQVNISLWSRESKR